MCYIEVGQMTVQPLEFNAIVLVLGVLICLIYLYLHCYLSSFDSKLIVYFGFFHF